MTFDLYGTTALTKKPAVTTAQALAAAEWKQLPDGSWELEWDDHTDYGEGDEEGNWSCQLYLDDGEWLYDFEHCDRGGPQLRNGLDVDGDASAEEAQVAVKAGLKNWIDRWTDSADEWRHEAEGYDE